MSFRRPRMLAAAVAITAVLSSVVIVAGGGAATAERTVARLAGGSIVVRSAPASISDCPSGFVCLWEHINFEGRMVGYSTCSTWFNLADITFNNLASSWRNRKSVDAVIADGANGNGDRLCLDNNSYSSSMPAGWNDQASSIRIRDDANHC